MQASRAFVTATALPKVRLHSVPLRMTRQLVRRGKNKKGMFCNRVFIFPYAQEAGGTRPPLQIGGDVLRQSFYFSLTVISGRTQFAPTGKENVLQQSFCK